MAEKKFFVDINLQGNKLSNAVVGQNTAMTTGGAFQYNANDTRLEYFNGSTTEQVANLSDIQAVTGGLIFQGGYDASTNTPDITDGTASKGFFWVVTTAGSFLGDSVQIGDSIIAKIDNAGTTLADWIILQGNVVIATETVDGISRLATQAEANAGTESGAVVITPATLQSKIDAQITPEINSKVSKSGDTMSGNLDMGGNNITGVQAIEASGAKINSLYTNGAPEIGLEATINAQNNSIINLPAPTNPEDAANKTYVDDERTFAINSANAYTNQEVATRLPLAGGTMSGSINLDGNALSQVGSFDVVVGGFVDMNGAAVNNVAPPVLGDQATNKTYVDGVGATAESNANAYTDTAIATEVTDRNNAIKATSFTASIEGSSGTSGWTFDAILGAYKAEITHNLGMFVTVSTFYDTYPTEFAGEYTNNVYYIYSNTEPVETTVVNFVKAGGNL